jgi:hypothetical protein
VAKFSASVIDTGGKFAIGVVDTIRKILTCKDISKFSKIFEMTQMFLEAWGKMIHKDTWSKKSRDTVPFRTTVCEEDVPYITICGRSFLMKFQQKLFNNSWHCPFKSLAYVRKQICW